jgi:hypothetical protein
MITPQDGSYRANEERTPISSHGTRDADKNQHKARGESGEIARALALVFERHQVVELRAFKGRETVSGYFDDKEALTRAARGLDGQGYAVYVTLNEVNPALLARAANRVRKVFREPTTSNHDIVRRRWLSLDLDPARPTGVSSTEEEKQAALLRCREVQEYLTSGGWPEPVVADSGNGAHLLYRVDLPNDRDSLQLVNSVLEALSFMFSDEKVKVDTSIGNAARIWKLYGTTARKGDHTQERPHRRSKLVTAPERVTEWQVVDRDKLEAVAVRNPAFTSRHEQTTVAEHGGHKAFDLPQWIDLHDVPIKREGPWGRDGYRYVLEECPWNGHTDNSAYIVRFASGAIAAGCHHNSCQGLGWRELRGHYEPGAYDRIRQLDEPDSKVPEEARAPKPTPWPTLRWRGVGAGGRHHPPYVTAFGGPNLNF